MLFVIFLPVVFGMLALVVDAGFYFVQAREAQNAADAGALAGARDLPASGGNYAAAEAMAIEYAVDRNLPEAGAIPTTWAADGRQKIKVDVTVDTNSYFGGVLGVGPSTITKSAVASASFTTTGSLGVYVHEVCGADTGDKGFEAAGDNMRIDGAIHVNGQFKVGNGGFVANSRTTVYRPSADPSLLDPAHPQGTCNGTAPLRIEDQSDSRYCVQCPTGETSDPVADTWRNWATPYHTDAIVKSLIPCTHSPTGDVKLENVSFADPRVYCLAPGKKFTLAGTVNGSLTVLADIIELGGTGNIQPASEAHPILLYNTSDKEMVLNPGSSYDWEGYVINREGGIIVNANDVTSPARGLLEAQWVKVNGANFRMIGIGPDPSSGTLEEVTLDE